MPLKRNKGGGLQPYVPAGNGDASGEYTNKESVKKFENFSKIKPSGEKLHFTSDDKEDDDFTSDFWDEKGNLIQKKVSDKLSDEENEKIFIVNKEKYDTGLYEYKNNCFFCVQTAVLNLLHNKDLSAPPRPKKESAEENTLWRLGWSYMIYEINETTDFQWYGYQSFRGKMHQTVMAHFYPPKGTFKNKAHLQKKQIEDIVKSAGDGAVFQCYVKWQGSNSAHIFNILNKKGEVLFIDPQNNKSCEHYFGTGWISGAYTCLARVDNLKINENIVKKYWGDKK